jgi:hypothetical protein
MAAVRGHVGVVRLLLERGADVNVNTPITALHAATIDGFDEVVSILLENGADCLIRENQTGFTALILAALYDYRGIARQLIHHMGGHGIDERTIRGDTALWWASKAGHEDIVRDLLLAGADHTIADLAGQTPRQAAEGNACVAMLEVSRRCIDHSQACSLNGALFRAMCKWGHTHYDAMVRLQWWDGELARAYALHRARRVHEDSSTRQQAPGALVPAYLRKRVERQKRLPRVQLQGDNRGRATRASAKRTIEGTGEQLSEEEKDATLKYVVHDLAPELYIELMAGFHM